MNQLEDIGANELERRYREIFLEPIRVSMKYVPKFGTNEDEGLRFPEFAKLYGSDPFYSWLGLDSKLMYAAHKAAGGMTSVYRQVGVGCERLFREIVIDTTGYEDRASAEWSYEARTQGGKIKTLKLDARLERESIRDKEVLLRVEDWIDDFTGVIFGASRPQSGVVFEIRQGYKSKDSKRQNADIDNATVAWSHGYMPVFGIFSGQIDLDLITRYRNNRSGILVGTVDDDPTISIYAFTKQVLGFDLAGFFQRNSQSIKTEMESILSALLSA